MILIQKQFLQQQNQSQLLRFLIVCCFKFVDQRPNVDLVNDVFKIRELSSPKSSTEMFNVLRHRTANNYITFTTTCIWNKHWMHQMPDSLFLHHFDHHHSYNHRQILVDSLFKTKFKDKSIDDQILTLIWIRRLQSTMISCKITGFPLLGLMFLYILIENWVWQLDSCLWYIWHLNFFRKIVKSSTIESWQITARSVCPCVATRTGCCILHQSMEWKRINV